MADHAAEIAAWMQDHDRTLAVAESLTGGMLSSRLAEAEDASEWYRGAVVAYSRDVKHSVLEVPPGPVVSEPAAAAMATGVARLLGADIAIGITGVGGPDEQDGQPPGTVWVALCGHGDVHTQKLMLEGDPGQVCSDAVTRALSLLLDYVAAG